MQDKFSKVLELQEQGKTRTEIWKILEYRDCSSLTKLMKSRNYLYNEQSSKYEPVGQKKDLSPTYKKDKLEPIGILQGEYNQLQENIINYKRI